MNLEKAIWLVDREKTYNIVGVGYSGIVFDGPSIPESELSSAYVAWLNNGRKRQTEQLILDRSEQKKSEYITSTPGKVFAYEQKNREVEAYTGGERDTAKLPMMSATAGELGMDIADVYAAWLLKTEEWKPIGARIEALYDKYKIELSSAVFETDQDVSVFEDSITFSLEEA